MGIIYIYIYIIHIYIYIYYTYIYIYIIHIYIYIYIYIYIIYYIVAHNKCSECSLAYSSRRVSLYSCSWTATSVWAHPHWAGVTGISENLSAKKMLFDITRYLCRSLGLNQSIGA